MNKRGCVIWAHDFGPYWVRLAAKAGLGALALHPIPNVEADDPRSLESFLEAIETESFKRGARELRENGVGLETEMHAMHWLLPRAEFAAHPDWFRMDSRGERTSDSNLCPGNEDALRRIELRTEVLARRIAPLASGHRYYLWIDDNGRYCRCERCAGLSASDQAMIIVNRMLMGVRRADPLGTLSYLAYQATTAAPTKVAPLPGVFLEYAPIDRDSRFAMDDPGNPRNAAARSHIPALLERFGRPGSQVLEYWMDDSYFYRWTPPYGELPFYRGVLRRDLAFYDGQGFERVTTFACGLNEAYEREYGEPPIVDYARAPRG